MDRLLGKGRARPVAVASMVALLGLALLPRLAGGATTTTCARFGTVPVAGGSYIVQQNEWNSHRRQCIAVGDGSWTITTASFNLSTSGPPASYPSIYKGCHWGLCTVASGLPIQIGSLASARSSWSAKQVDSGAYNVSFDLWTNTTPTTSGQPDGSEIMIWLSSRGGVQPAGSNVGTVSIAGATWEVWTTRMSGWNYIAYRRTTGASSVSKLDLKAFLDDSVSRGSTSDAWYLIDAEAGFEIWMGGKDLATRSFSFAAS